MNLGSLSSDSDGLNCWFEVLLCSIKYNFFSNNVSSIRFMSLVTLNSSSIGCGSAQEEKIKKANVIDLGAGYGVFCNLIRKNKNFTPIGVEPSETLSKNLKIQKILTIKLIRLEYHWSMRS